MRHRVELPLNFSAAMVLLCSEFTTEGLQKFNVSIKALPVAHLATIFVILRYIKAGAQLSDKIFHDTQLSVLIFTEKLQYCAYISCIID
jgi:hypothetical protein